MDTEKKATQLTPVYREWAEKYGTPWVVIFPRQPGESAPKRKFYPDEATAKTAISEFKNGTVAHAVTKRKLDEMAWCQSMLPEGVSVKDAVRFYLDHHTGANTVTVGDVADAYLLDLKKKSEDYRTEQGRAVGDVVDFLGRDTLFSALSRAKLLSYIKGGETYWVRYARKRAVSALITKAKVEMEAIRISPLEGWVFEDAPKKTPHFLKNEDVEAILRYTKANKPELLVPFILQLYFGIRTEELCRNEDNGKRPLHWEDITFGKRIIVPIEVSKTGDRRSVDYWPPAVNQWIALTDVKKGPVCSVSELDSAKTRLITALQKERTAEGLPKVGFKQNDFRRTYATNSVALFGGEKTKARMGHQENSKVLKKNYDGLTEQEEALAFFGEDVATFNKAA